MSRIALPDSLATWHGRPPTRHGRRYFVRTFGCQMNEHDSERIAGMLEADGMAAATGVDEADVIVVNTCTVRENADNRLYGYLGALKAVKDRCPDLRIIVGGCTAQKDREVIRQRAGWVDVVLGTHNLHRVLDLLDHAEERGPVTEIWDEAVSIEEFPSSLPTRRATHHSAWVTITIGCDNSCTFCIVPSVRGREMSRRPDEIMREIEDLAADGVVEVMLLGQNVNSYGRDLDLGGRKPLFADLLRRAGEVDGVRRVRFTSPHPKDFGPEVAEAMASTEAVCEQLHLPLQSGSDRILAAMHRGYRADRFLEKLEMAHSLIPGLSVSTDVIVGFPGETEEDFTATLEVVRQARFDQAYTFQFSPRAGTPAAEMGDQVAPPVVQERFDRLVTLQNRISLEKNEEMVGRRYEVLVEGASRKDAEMVTARTRGNKPVHLPGDHAAGTFLTVQIERAAPHHLMGRLAF